MSKLLTALFALAFAATAFAQGTAPAPATPAPATATTTTTTATTPAPAPAASSTTTATTTTKDSMAKPAVKHTTVKKKKTTKGRRPTNVPLPLETDAVAAGRSPLPAQD